MRSLRRVAASTAAAGCLFGSGIAAASEGSALESEARALQARWAPAYVQETSGEHPERDRPLPIDFDGDWDATNNWRNLTPAMRGSEPVAYGAAILTETHAYLSYLLFYPRDWTSPVCVSLVCHDNDLEAVLLIVERPLRAEDAGKLVLVETKAHRGYPSLTGEEVALDGAGHPLLEVESEGHGIYPVRRGRPVGDQRRIRFLPIGDEDPSAARVEHYRLLSIHDTLWAHRSADAEHGSLWTAGETGFLGYRGSRFGRRGWPLGTSMAQSEYGGGVRPPWGLEAAPGTRGDWFLDPAFVANARHAAALSAKRPPSTSYVYNPFLDDLSAECIGQACPAVAGGRATRGLPWGGFGAVMVALGLASFRKRRSNAV